MPPLYPLRVSGGRYVNWDNSKNVPFEKFLEEFDFEYNNGVGHSCLFGHIWFNEDSSVYLERIHWECGTEFWKMHLTPKYDEFSKDKRTYYFI